MSFLSKQVPDYFRGKRQLVHTVMFTVLFALVFLIVALPFSTGSWMALGRSWNFLYTAGFIVLSGAIIAVSRTIMYKTRNRLRLTYLWYILWCIGEILAIVLIYSFMTIGILGEPWDEFFWIFGRALVYGSFALVIPYVLCGLYYAVQDRDRIIRLMDYRNVVSDESVPASRTDKITLIDASGVMKLCVSASNLYLIESNDNYIIVRYTDSRNEMQSYMMRCRLKTVEESFKGSSLVRCNRSTIVNIDKVKVVRKEKDGYVLELDSELISPIPITKTYAGPVLGKFNGAAGKASS